MAFYDDADSLYDDPDTLYDEEPVGDTGRVGLSCTGLPDVLGLDFYVERRVPGGDWEYVRGGAPAEVSGGAIDLYDYEYTPNVLNEYRTRTAIFFDGFNRTVANDWGAADSGQDYTLSGGTAANWDVAAGVGTYLMGDAAGVISSQTLAAPVLQDFDYYTTIQVDQLPTGDDMGSILYSRVGGSADCALVAAFETDGSLSLSIIGNNGASTLVAQANAVTTAAPNIQIFLRWQGEGRTLRAKAWTGGPTAEPFAWTISTTDTVNADDGVFWISGYRGASNTNVNPTLTFDNFIIWDLNTVNPQMTLFCESQVVPSQDNVWLKFPLRPFLNRPITLCNWGPETRAARGEVFKVLGRTLPVAVTDVRTGREFDIIIKAEDSTEAEAIELALSFGDTILLQTPGPLTVCLLNRRNYPASGYFFVGPLVSTRVVDGRFTLSLEASLEEVSPPDPSIYGASVTWQGIMNNFATWQDVIDFFGDWADVLAYTSDPEDEIVG